jgi:soluble lytic murein transglycosylase-like protein
MDGITGSVPIANPPEETRSGGKMRSLIKKIEADVQSRKRPHTALWPAVRVVGGLAVVFALAYQLGASSASAEGGWVSHMAAGDRIQQLTAQVDALQGQLDFQTLQVERMKRAYDLSAKYRIGADLATDIEEIALAENVDPALAFELVRVESDFNPRAVSPVGALGYTQLMPPTARLLVPGITREQLFQRETNLRLGFRFLRMLVNHYNGDIRLALLAYNRGPDTVDRLLRAGIDPGNGYSKLVLGK